MNIAFLIIIILFVWRFSHLIAYENGPFDIVLKTRLKIGDNFFGKLMDCFYCLSIWISFIPAFAFADGILQIFLLIFAFSGGAIILEKLTNKNV